MAGGKSTKARMSHGEALSFVAFWRRILMPWPTPHNEIQAARTLKNSFTGLAFGPILGIVPFLVFGPVRIESILGQPWALTALFTLIILMTIANYLRLKCQIAWLTFHEIEHQ